MGVQKLKDFEVNHIPKIPNNVFWPHQNFGQLTTNRIFIFFVEIFTQHVVEE